jgi:hypothetical protein
MFPHIPRYIFQKKTENFRVEIQIRKKRENTLMNKKDEEDSFSDSSLGKDHGMKLMSTCPSHLF